MQISTKTFPKLLQMFVINTIFYISKNIKFIKIILISFIRHIRKKYYSIRTFYLSPKCIVIIYAIYIIFYLRY